jgi:hypothetical protein
VSSPRLNHPYECPPQGCQTAYFQNPKIPIWVNFGGP